MPATMEQCALGVVEAAACEGGISRSADCASQTKAVAGVFSTADSQCSGNMRKFTASTANRAPRCAAPERPVARV
jgi:hypothetical protein